MTKGFNHILVLTEFLNFDHYIGKSDRVAIQASLVHLKDFRKLKPMNIDLVRGWTGRNNFFFLLDWKVEPVFSFPNNSSI